MAIINEAAAEIKHNLKPLRPTGKETKKELLVRFNKWLTWWDQTLVKLQKENNEERERYARYKERLDVEIVNERSERGGDTFHCSCHYIKTLNELYNLVSACVNDDLST